MTNCNTSEAKSEESSLTICASPTASFADESSATTRDQAWRSRVLYCRKCDGHGKQVALKGHAPKCPYNLCECQSCSKLMTKRLHSFKKRNKSRLEAAAILTAQKKAQLAALGKYFPHRIMTIFMELFAPLAFAFTISRELYQDYCYKEGPALER
ncbi:unnamed protein product [Toxocara canis]|uniref:DM domain-containing protein n=1 Tax=Toxocara canis TaxID=6265 RepID=A0A183V8Q6_TOXCA|nr:unnamed protein product [Toxocara canis]